MSKNEHLIIRVPSEFLEFIDERMKNREFVTRSEYIRELIRKDKQGV